MLTPSSVWAYWMRGSIAQPFYDIAPELGCFRLHHEARKAHQA